MSLKNFKMDTLKGKIEKEEGVNEGEKVTRVKKKVTNKNIKVVKLKATKKIK